MRIERFYLGCLSQASFLIHDGGEAAVIDPRRDVDIYIDRARELGVRIRWVIETHLHADFVSGHLELARRTGAEICIGAGSGAAFEHRALRDDDELALGGVNLRILATPGHTEESICIVTPEAVFTGDTLFAGDVGRPDLSPTKTPQELAALLFDSLHRKLMALPDSMKVYPAHGAGSLCGKSMSADAFSTIGHERRCNYALLPMDVDDFVEMLTGHLPPRPAYFADEVERNRAGAPAVSSLAPLRRLHAGPAGAVVLDTRSADAFAAGHVRGALNIALSGQFASWAARILGIDAEVALVADDEAAAQEARVRLARVGIENVAGLLDPSCGPVQTVQRVSVRELSGWVATGLRWKTLIDVRERAERVGGSIPGSLCIPLAELPSRIGEIDPNTEIVVHCKSGYRSSVAAGLLQAAGFRSVSDLAGGYDVWGQAQPNSADA
jgi:glyoxylase-like metal-dependent hydrolase (beta-lactamase superfamily II)/rhodanese-related sulfurtransferase